MKKPLISVVVPTKNSEGFLEQCLRTIKEQTYKNLEIIVVDNNSTDKTKEIAKKYTKLIFNKGPERSTQRNYGASKARGDYLLFIDSDMELTKNVVKDCIRRIQNTDIGGLIIPEESFGKGFWARCKTLERSFYVGVDWIEAARFFPKDVFNQVGGYDETQISGEDWDLNQRVGEKHRLGRIKSYIKHNEGDLSLLNLLRKKMHYAGEIKNYSSKKQNILNSKQQFSLRNRYMLFFANPRRLLSNPLIGIGMLFMKTSEFAAGGIGYYLKR